MPNASIHTPLERVRKELKPGNLFITKRTLLAIPDAVTDKLAVRIKPKVILMIISTEDTIKEGATVITFNIKFLTKAGTFTIPKMTASYWVDKCIRLTKYNESKIFKKIDALHNK